MTGNTKAEKRQPWFRFYTADWRGDAGLRAVGYAARGLWMDMLSLMHEATPYGHLVLNGSPLDASRLAARLGGSAKEVQGLIDRLETEAVFSRTDDGVIFSRRMVADWDKAQRDRENGGSGGNPALKNKPQDIPTSAETYSDNINPYDNGGVNPLDNLPHNRQVKARAPANQKPEIEVVGFEVSTNVKPRSELRSLVQKQPKSDAPFDIWWSFYPRKVGKDDARKAYFAALKRGTTHAELLAAIQRQSWHSDPERRPHPATWLNGGRWQDDPDAAAPPKQSSLIDQVRHDLGLDEPLTIDHEEPCLVFPH